MDTVTHAFVGTAIADGFFRRRLGPVATPFSLAAAALPDIDIVTYFMSPTSAAAWAHHRGYTHSFFMMLLASPLLSYAGYRLAGRRGGWRSWWLLTILCLFSHTLIDLVTSWGTMPWLPFSNARVSWDVAPILDVFVFSLTAASFVANRILRWERVETFMNPLAYPVVHSHPRRQRAGDWVGMVVVGLTVVYLLLGWHQNRQTVRIARRELAAAGVEAVEVRALPIMFTYIAWDIVARDAAGAIYNAPYSSYAGRPMAFSKFVSDSGPVVDKALATDEGKLFAWYSQNMYRAAVENGVPATRVYLEDRRFIGLSRPERARFAMEFEEGADGKVRWVRIIRDGMEGINVRDELRRLWDFTWTGEFAPAEGAGLAEQ